MTDRPTRWPETPDIVTRLRARREAWTCIREEAASEIEKLVAERDEALTRMEGLVNNLSFRISEAKDWKERAEKVEVDLAAARAFIREVTVLRSSSWRKAEEEYPEHAAAIAAEMMGPVKNCATCAYRGLIEQYARCARCIDTDFVNWEPRHD